MNLVTVACILNLNILVNYRNTMKLLRIKYLLRLIDKSSGIKTSAHLGKSTQKQRTSNVNVFVSTNIVNNYDREN